MSNTPRAFIDSSVLIAAAISTTSSARDLLLLYGGTGRVTILWSLLVLQETRRNLAKKAPQALPMLNLLPGALTIETVVPSQRDITRASQLIDAKDAPIVAAAMSGRADWPCTYDRRHLLSKAHEVERFLGLRIVTPDIIIDELSTSGQI